MKIKIAKFGKILNSRPAGREAFASFFSYLPNKLRNEPIHIDFNGILSLAPSWLDEFIQQGKKRGLHFKFGKSKNTSVNQTLKTLMSFESPEKLHPWRLCPMGQHWVKSHPRKTQSLPGYTVVDGHCRLNPSKKDSLYKDEIEKISERFPTMLKTSAIIGPSKDRGKYKNGDAYDDFIAGWTQYWNDLFKPRDRLHPTLVKALIALESSFGVHPSGSGRAIGLMQLMPETLKILGNSKGELRDYLIHLTKKSALNPNMNICAGIRWLFHKKHLASVKSKKEVSWIEAVAEYKSVLRKPLRYPKVMQPFLDYLEKHQ